MVSHEALHRHTERIGRMLADPDCHGDLLIVGIVCARAVDLGQPEWEGLTLNTIADLALTGQERRWAIRTVIRDDIRRYKTTSNYWAVTCGRPMLRRDGLCGRNGTHKKVVVDVVSGERTWIGACSNVACRAWLDAVAAENRRLVEEHPPPVPPANRGGVLDRHLPEIDWWAIWRHLDPKWSPPPEGNVWRRPTLTVLVEDEPQPAATSRPALTVLEGGWR